MALQAGDLGKYKYFSELSQASLEMLAGRIRTVEFPAGAEILKEGATGDSFYFVSEGKLEVTKKTRSGQTSKLSVIGSGQAFGEMALLTCTVRSSSVTAVTDVVLYELAKSDFEEVILRESEFRGMLYQTVKDRAQSNKLRTLKPFELLPPEKMYMVIEKLAEKPYPAGCDIIVQGEKGDCINCSPGGDRGGAWDEKNGGGSTSQGYEAEGLGRDTEAEALSSVRRRC
ncbi:MAG: cyclic nucleotide-binding domain-containing protein [Nitrospiraceae bacterium]|nr:cyclic nucleotide-binding domain-containing protein [Nitrospiraceae bacterium]